MNVYSELSQPVALIIFILTLLLPVGVGLFAMRRTRNTSDFYVGGRKLNQFTVALSAVSSGRSSWLILGVSGMAYALGTGAVWACAGYIIVEMLQFITIGKKLRQQTEQMDAITLLDYFESRFNDRSHLLRWTGAIIIGLFVTAYVASQLNAGGKALSLAMNMPLLLALIVSAGLILIYMMLGGFIAVAYNDMIRAIIMIIGLVIFPAIGLMKVGGLSALLGTLQALDPRTIDPLSIGFGAMIGFLGIGLGSPGQPHIVVRYMAVKDPNKLRHAMVIGTIWNVILGWGAVMVGLIGRALIPNIHNLPNADSEMIYIVLASDFFGPVFYGLIIGGIFAAILSTADSQLLVIASTFVRDIYEKIFHSGKTMDDRKELILSRWVVAVSGILAIGLAYCAKDIIFWLVLFSWGGLGASFGSSLILSLFWKDTHRYGVFAGMVSGSLITIIWKLYLKAPTGLYELIPAFAGALLLNVIVSVISSKKQNHSSQ